MRPQIKKSPHTSPQLRGAALGMAIVVALLIALISGFFVMRSHLDRMVTLHYDLKSRLMHNAGSGIQYLLSSQQEVGADSELLTDLFGEKRDSVLLQRKTWGAMEILVAQATCANQSYIRRALAGGGPAPVESRTGLYVCDLDKNLSLCGNTVLKGKTYLPDEGVRRAYIEGQSYSGDKLVYGTQLLSTRHLPPVREELFAALAGKLSGRFNDSDSSVHFMERSSDSLSQSFEHPTLVLYAEGTMLVSQVYLHNNILLYASGRILIGADCTLDGVLVLAPVIEIESGFQGNIQAFVTQQLLIGDDVILDYPSVAGLLSSTPVAGVNHHITIGQNCHMGGTLFARAMTQDQENKPYVETAEGFEMDGEIYADCALDLKGRVHGSVWCRKLVLRTSSAVYENHLLNVQIDPQALSPHYCGTTLFEHNRRSILRWF